MVGLIIKQPDGTERTVLAHTATLEEIVTWINQAPDASNRSERKQMMQYRLYGNPQPLFDLMKSNPKPGA